MKILQNTKSIKGISIIFLVSLIMGAYIYINVTSAQISQSPSNKTILAEEKNSVLKEIKIAQYLISKVFQTYDFDRSL